MLALWVALTPPSASNTSKIANDFFNRIDYLIYDVRLIATRTYKASSTNFPISIIAIDEKSISDVGEWPWSYDIMAKLISKLREQGAAVIALNMIFSEPADNIISVIKQKLTAENLNSNLPELNKLSPNFDYNSKLIDQVRNKNDIVLSFLLYKQNYRHGQLPAPIGKLNHLHKNDNTILNMRGYITNFQALQKASKNSGFITLLTDDDGILRRVPLVLRYKNSIYPSLSLKIAEVYLAKNRIKLDFVHINKMYYLDSINLNQQNIPTDNAGQVMVPFHEKSPMFKHYSATDVLNNKLHIGELKNSIVLVGVTAPQYGNYFGTSIGEALPKIEIIGHVVNGILKDRLTSSPYWSHYVTIGLILIIGTILTLFLPRLAPTSSVFFSFAVLILLIVTNNIILWFLWHVVIYCSIPLIMIILQVLTSMTYGYLFENRKKKLLQAAFGQYVPTDYVNILLDNSNEYSLDGESCELTVLFADIRNFTKLSEDMDANAIKKILNQYFTPMTSIIFQYDGTIDKYVGDMIMAFWGAPLKNDNHRTDAINASLDMLLKSNELKTIFAKEGFPELSIGIGLNTGIMNVGDMGSEFRRAYTVLGDPVNIGARLESATKYYGVHLIVGSETRANQNQFLFRLLDKIRIKGKQISIDIYEVMGRMNDATASMIKEAEAHEEALFTYFKMDFTRANKLFTKLHNEFPEKHLYVIFLERIKYFKKNPPPNDWDGSYEFMEK